MEAYTSFAQVYDMFMDNIDYEEWGKYLLQLLKEQGVSEGIVLDMGCGTGSITKILSKAGYDMIGIDNSQDMLNIAMEKREDEEILYLLQDMREFELYGTVAACVCICDSINYVTDYEDLVQVLKLVNNYLDPGGVFIFDMNTIEKYRQIGDSTIAEDREESSFIWDNYFDEEDNVNEYGLTIFIKGDDGRYDKFSETHYQKAYSIEEMRQAIEEAGLEFVTAFDAFTHDKADEDCERVYIIAREKTK